MDEILDLQALSLLMREVIVVLCQLEYNVFIDTDIVPTGVIKRGTRSLCTNVNERSNYY